MLFLQKQTTPIRIAFHTFRNSDIDSEEGWWWHTPLLEPITSPNICAVKPLMRHKLLSTNTSDGQYQVVINSVLHRTLQSFYWGSRS